MDKSCNNSSGGEAADSAGTTTTASSGTSGSSSRDMYLKHLNKLSHKISKPIRNNNNNQAPGVQIQHAPPLPPPSAAAAAVPPQQQPPVYNINKSDFRDVVQKLTGSPAHERISNPPPPPPIQQPKAPSSRLQRIRPPPLAQLSNRPQTPFVNAVNHVSDAVSAGGFVFGQRPVVQPQQPLSPLPPFPAVHAAAESPISAYMRFLQGSISSAGPSWLSPLVPPQQQPRFPQPQQQNQNIPPPSTAPSSVLPPFPAFPSSPLPFGCLPSPKSPYGLLSPGGLLMSPSGQLGFQQLPLSPTVPAPSPKWKGI